MKASMTFLEPANVFILISCLGIIFALGEMLWRERREWRKPFWIAAATIWILAFGLGGRQAWLLVWRMIGGGGPEWMTDNLSRIGVLYAFSFLIAVGASGIVRSFSKERWGDKLWVFFMTMACIGFAITFFFYSYDL
jgi:hypothetical protein